MIISFLLRPINLIFVKPFNKFRQDEKYKLTSPSCLNLLKAQWGFQKIYLYVLLGFLSLGNLPVAAIDTLTQKSIIVVIPSYNNRNYYQKNLDSIIAQNYDNYHVIYIDDASSDRTGALVRSYIEKHHLSSRITLIEKKQRRGALENLYNTIHSCQDDAIIITVDGDDWLANHEVFSIINRAYADTNVWITFGQFVFHPDGRVGYCRDIMPEEFDRGRRWCHVATHMRTFYAGLFKKIKREDLLQEDGKFFEVTWDKAMMAPMLEMANRRWKFIPDIVYVYNFINPLSDARLYGNQQVATAELIYKKKQYLPLPGPLPY